MPTTPNRFQRFVQAYKSFALLSFNSVFLFLLALLLLNAGLFVAFKIYDARFQRLNPIWRKYGEHWKELYPGLRREEVNQLLNESWERALIYEPFTAFRIAPFKGRYYTMRPQGFRACGPDAAAPWPPDKDALNVFVLGGSTTLGYAVEDSQTIPCHLEYVLQSGSRRKVRVYNFGRAGYYSTQERILFEQLLAVEPRPRLVVFIDGLNDLVKARDVPDFTDKMVALTDPNPWKALRATLPRVYESLPMARFVGSFSKGFLAFAVKGKVDLSAPKSSWSDADTATAFTRYRRNKQMIESVARTFGVSTLFVWQPQAFYHAKPEASPYKDIVEQSYAAFQRRYEWIAQELQRHPLDGHFYWAADMQQNLTGPLYVDAHHYSGGMSRQLAEKIASYLRGQGLLPDTPIIRKSLP